MNISTIVNDCHKYRCVHICYWVIMLVHFAVQIMKYLSRKAGKLCKCLLACDATYLEYECMKLYSTTLSINYTLLH